MFTVEENGYKVGDLVRIDERFNPDHNKVGVIVSIFDDYTVEVDLGRNAMSNLFKVDSIRPATLHDYNQLHKHEQPKRIRGFELCKGFEDCKLPVRKTKYSAGYDFFAQCDMVIMPHSTSETVLSGVKAYMPEDEYLAIHIRSSLAFKQGLILVNCTGIVDSDFFDNPDNEGNIGFKFYNTSDNVVYITKGSRIAQGIFMKYLVADNCNSDDVRKGGIGSTNG